MDNTGCSAQKTEQRIDQLAADILSECSSIDKQCQANRIPPPSLSSGSNTAFWSEASPQLVASRTRALGLLDRLTTLLQGPHNFLHELVAPNWDHGALYAFLRSRALEHIASSGGQATLGSLSTAAGIPEDKLFRILALLRCKNIVHEPHNGVFALTAVSEELIRDGDFRAWVEFQLFETRVASVHLADALSSTPNDYTNGKSGFKQGWGMEMYDWHAAHPEKGDRFRRAMKGVSKSLDPADSLIRTWIQHSLPSSPSKVVEMGGRYGFASIPLVSEHPELTFEIRCDSQDFLRRGEALVQPEHSDRIVFSHVASLFDQVPPADANDVNVYVIRNLFWNWADDDVVKLLRTLLPTLQANTRSKRVLVTDGVSPLSNEFPPHVEIAYRRRDITTMTMHNVKQRSQDEWLDMFSRVDPDLKVTTNFEHSSHVCKGLWELRLEA